MPQWLQQLGLGFSFSSALLFLLAWWRFYKRDKSNRSNKDANTTKTLAEAYQIKMSAELSIAMEWKKVADTFKTQIEEEREQCVQDMDRQRSHFEGKIKNLESQVNLLREELKSR